MLAKLAKSYLCNFVQGFAYSYFFIALSILVGCDSDGSGAQVDYQDSWVSETPSESTMAISVNDSNGQSQTANTDGEMTLYVEFTDGGMLNVTYEFFSVSPPLCSLENPCTLQGSLGNTYEHRYLGKQVTPEGLVASYIRIVNGTDTNYADGYAYVSEDRLCMSYGLWQFLHLADEAANDPLATDFNRCFIQN